MTHEESLRITDFEKKNEIRAGLHADETAKNNGTSEGPVMVRLINKLPSAVSYSSLPPFGS